jgi:polyphenol oxidase
MFKKFKKYPNLFVSFSERKDGSMKFPQNNPRLLENNLKNRKLYFQKFDLQPQDVASSELVHGGYVAQITRQSKGKRMTNADGLITKEKSIFLSVTAADCLPIFIFEPKNEIASMIHAGWRSIEKGILFNAIEKINKLGGRSENILAGIGPAICQKHYEVGLEVAEKFVRYPEAIKKDGGKIYLDIKKIAQIQLLELGLERKNIEVSPKCTFELPDKYFSARRDKSAEIKAMIAVIGMKK